MNRRNFLRLSGAAAAGFALDPDKLLWVPGQKTFFFVQQPLRHISIAELVAVTWDKVMKEHARNQWLWTDERVIRAIAEGEHDRLLRTRPA